MNKVSLGYWRMRGRGQVPRLLLVYTGATWEDIQYSAPEQWFGGDKESLGLDFPNLPYVIEGDFKITETLAVCSYIVDRSSKREQLLGQNYIERAKIINVQLILIEMFDKLNQVAYSPQTPESKEKIWKENIVPKLQYLSKFKGSYEWIFGRLTLPDFLLTEISFYIENIYPGNYKEFPFLNEIRTRFHNLPEIKKYYEQ